MKFQGRGSIWFYVYLHTLFFLVTYLISKRKSICTIFLSRSIDKSNPLFP